MRIWLHVRNIGEVILIAKKYILNDFCTGKSPGLLDDLIIIEGKSPIDALRKRFPQKKIRRAQDEYEKRLSAFILQECVIVNERPRIAGIQYCYIVEEK